MTIEAIERLESAGLEILRNGLPKGKARDEFTEILAELFQAASK
jgi:hypothetical protein